MTEAVLSLGGNIGDREFFITEAMRRLLKDPHVYSLERSGLYETSPVGYTEQDSFLNACVRIETDLEAMELLSLVNRIENELGRVRTIRWGPRTIDIDIIFYGDDVIDTDRLTVPHPRYKERAFVTVPLMDLGIETTGRTEDEGQSVRKIGWTYEI
jgi:2-amino-4-hydroxy-6-hydroxymethyldihydropteridine diphosphokinase